MELERAWPKKNKNQCRCKKRQDPQRIILIPPIPFGKLESSHRSRLIQNLTVGASSAEFKFSNSGASVVKFKKQVPTSKPYSISQLSTMYSVSNMKLDRKPPLAKSPMRLRPRRVLRPSNSFSLQTPPPPGSLTESRRPIGCQDMEESELRPEYRTISCELRALTNMVREELGTRDTENIASADSLGVDSGMLFERGRLYDAYSAKRNERLKRKQTGGDYVKAPASAYNLGVAVESAKKSSSKKLESLRKSVSGPRYMLRSRTKGDKKLPPLPPNSNVERSSAAAAAGVDKKIGGSRVRRI